MADGWEMQGLRTHLLLLRHRPELVWSLRRSVSWVPASAGSAYSARGVL